MKPSASLFEQTPAVLPVIHVESLDQALRNTEIARNQQCNGVFLINHDMSHEALLEIHHNVFTAFPDWWIGINCLDLEPWEIFSRITDEVSGVWVDNAYIDEQAEKQTVAEKITKARLDSGWQGLYFGGVAFKYQRPIDDLARAATLAKPFMDVVTTSGSGTGRAAHVNKIQTMKQAIGDFPLAIASGITPDNVHHYLGIADCFLVATGISQSWTALDPALVGKLVSQVRMSAGN
ncbi:MAG: BtpA/SgcQ family protein [Chloroflexota bacterium]